MKTIELAHGRSMLVDNKDHMALSQFNYHLLKQDGDKCVVRTITHKGKTVHECLFGRE